MICFTLGTLAMAAPDPHPEMHLFLDLARQARDSTISGDVEAAQNSMKQLVAMPSLGEFPKDAQPHLLAMKAAAEAGSKSNSVDELGHAVSRIAAACGACHAATDGGPKFERIGKPPKEKDLASHMKLHAWSANRMWEALVVPEQDRWEAGAKALYQESWIHSGAFDMDSEFARRVHETGEAAMVATRDAERTALYGQFIASCAACHRSGGVKTTTP